MVSRRNSHGRRAFARENRRGVFPLSRSDAVGGPPPSRRLTPSTRGEHASFPRFKMSTNGEPKARASIGRADVERREPPRRRRSDSASLRLRIGCDATRCRADRGENQSMNRSRSASASRAFASAAAATLALVGSGFGRAVRTGAGPAAVTMSSMPACSIAAKISGGGG